MFKHFFLSELKYSLKQPMVYIFTFIVGALVFAAVSSDSVQIGGSIGNVYKNSPYVITTYVSIMCIFGLLMATAFFNNAALRDYQNNFNEILFTTPLSKPGYFFGRFFGALILATIPIMGVYLGMLLATAIAPAVGWEEPDRFGPFFLETFINTYVLFIVPNMLFSGAIIYGLSHKFKSTVISFVGTLLIIISYILSDTLMSDLDNEQLGAFLDMFGMGAFTLATKYFTPLEKNTVTIGFSGLFVWSRLFWFGIGMAILAVSYMGFSFQTKNKKVKAPKVTKEENQAIFEKPVIQPSWGSDLIKVQFWSFFKVNFINIYKSITFKILAVFSVIMMLGQLIGGFEYFGLQSYPLTYKMIDAIDSSSGIFIIIILVFYSGELIWRDRDSHINEVIDATPHVSVVSLLAKAFSLVATVFVLRTIFVLIGIIYQLLNGYTRIELDVYLLEFFYTSFFTYLVWSLVMVSIQVLVNHKYLGYFVSILVIFVWGIILNIADISSRMVRIASAPNVMYSDMNGFGPGLNGAMWFHLYWMLFAMVLLLFAGMVWNRGVNESLFTRLKRIPSLVPKSYFFVFGSFVVAFASVGSWVFYNTQVLNTYHTSDEQEAIAVAYEKTYKKYAKMHHPKVLKAKYEVDIYPAERNLRAKATYVITNEHDTPIDSIHFNLDANYNIKIEIPSAKLVHNDTYLEYQIYALDQPLMPGEKREMTISSDYITKGFPNGMGSTSVIKNGTFINNFSLFPAFGYNASVEISDKNKRKKLGLPEKERMPKLEIPCGHGCEVNYLTDGFADYIPIETIISTSNDQMAIAPGSLLKEWQENDRNYFHYKIDHVSQNFVSFISARYEVAKRKWNGIDLEVYYHQDHEVNVPMMLDAIERSLTYYTTHFGPYFHKQCRIIEFPRYATFAQAFPGTMPYSEAFGFVTNLEDESENNVIDAVIAHEMAHQWWAHQVVGAHMQGGTFLSEAFAEYSSLMTMKSITPNPMKMRAFLKYDHNRYLRGRGGELEGELPLYKVENQTYIHYGKGAVVLYALQDYIGEDSLNATMRDFLDATRYRTPYPTSVDFLNFLEPRVPDSLKYVVNDWFKTITLYDNRVKECGYKKLDDGNYEVTLTVSASKIMADSVGNVTPLPLQDYIDVGLFADEEEMELIYVNRVLMTQPETTLVFTVDTIPNKAAIDPKHLLIDRVFDDNIKTLKAW